MLHAAPNTSCARSDSTHRMPKRKADPKTPTHAEGYELVLSDKGFSGYLGVTYNKGAHGKGKPWLATYYIGATAEEKRAKGFVYLGCFPDKVSAAVAYAKYRQERNGSPEQETQQEPNKRSRVCRREQEMKEEDGEAEDEGDTAASLPHLKPGSIRYHIVRALLAGTSEREEIVEYVTEHSEKVGANGGGRPRNTIMTKLTHEPKESGVPLWGKFEGTTTYSLTAAGEALRALVGDAEEEEEEEQEEGGEEEEEEGEEEEGGNEGEQEEEREEREEGGEEEQEEEDLCCRTCGRSFERGCALATHERFCRKAAERQTKKAERQAAAATAAAEVAADDDDDDDEGGGGAEPPPEKASKFGHGTVRAGADGRSKWVCELERKAGVGGQRYGQVAPGWVLVSAGGEEAAATSREEKAGAAQPPAESILERGIERARRAAKRATTAVTPTPAAAQPSPATQPARARAVVEMPADMAVEGPPIPAAADFMGVFVDPATGRWCFHTKGVTTRGFPSALAALAACEANEPQSGAADVLQPPWLQTPSILRAA